MFLLYVLLHLTSRKGVRFQWLIDFSLFTYFSVISSLTRWCYVPISREQRANKGIQIISYQIWKLDNEFVACHQEETSDHIV